MRKEVRIGLAIGGVLIAVVVVFLLSTGNHNKPGTDLAHGDADPQQQTTVDVTPIAPRPVSPGSVSPVAVAPTASQPATPGPSADTSAVTPKPNSMSQDSIARSLTFGSTPLVSETPSPSRGEVLDNGGGASAQATPPAHTDASSPAADHTSAASDPVVRTEFVVPATQPMDARSTHVVQSHETFSSIAKTAYGDARYASAIIKANPNVNPNMLRVHSVIVLPPTADVIPLAAPVRETPSPTTGPSSTVLSEPAVAPLNAITEYRVAAGDSLYKISIKLYGDIRHQNEIYEANQTAIGPDRAKLKQNMVLKLVSPPTVAH